MTVIADIGERATLADGNRIPWLGLGTYRLGSQRRAREAVECALEVGYRHLDTAAFYGTEETVGRAVRDSGVPREELFITTKLWNSDHGREAARRGFEDSLRRLGLDHVDLYLIHWPVPDGRLDSWAALQEIREEGLARSIGVSNYTIAHLRELLTETDVVPVVNQVELSPFLPQPRLRQFCAERDILVEGYSPLTKGRRLDDPRLAEIGRRHGKTPAQVLIRWHLEERLPVIPKSSRPEHIRENAEVFDFRLTDEDMAALGTLEEGLRTSWDPTGQA